MTVLFFPDFTDGNPYQRNLAEGLRARDERVEMGRQAGHLSILSSVRDTEDVSVVHFHWFHPYLFATTRVRTALRVVLVLFQLAVCRLLGISVVWTVHNVLAHDSPHPGLEQLFKTLLLRLRLCTTVFVHCGAVRETLLSEHCRSESLADRVLVVPHGHYIDNYPNRVTGEQARAELNLDCPGTVFLFFGQIRAYKDVPTLVESFQRTCGADDRLLIAGKPTTPALATDISNRTDGDSRIQFYPEFIPDDRIQVYMNAADVVVLPYDDITTSGSAVLAMSFGKPLVAPRLGCLPEMVPENGAILYPPEGLGILSDALTDIMNEPHEVMGERNYERAREFDWDSIAGRTRAAYRR